MVRKKGLEPSQDFSHSHLKAACLPFHHLRIDYIINKKNYLVTTISKKSYQTKK